MQSLQPATSAPGSNVPFADRPAEHHPGPDEDPSADTSVSQMGWRRDSPCCLDDEAATCCPLPLVVRSCAGDHLGQLGNGLPPGGQGDEGEDEVCRIEVAIE